MRACRLASWGGEVTGWVLPEVGAGALAQRATVLQPGHVGWWLPVSLAVQPQPLPLQDAVLLRGARAPDPGGHCGRVGVVRPGAVAGAGMGVGHGERRVQTYPARPPRSPCGPPPGHSRPHMCRCQPGLAVSDSAGGGPPGRPHHVPHCFLWDGGVWQDLTCSDPPPQLPPLGPDREVS